MLLALRIATQNPQRHTTNRLLVTQPAALVMQAIACITSAQRLPTRSPFATKSLGGLMNSLMNPDRVELSRFYFQSLGLGIGESVRPHAARICTLTQKKLAAHQ